jgi:hypothetical protein
LPSYPKAVEKKLVDANVVKEIERKVNTPNVRYNVDILLADKPASALKRIGDNLQQKLQSSYGIKTVADLARSPVDFELDINLTAREAKVLNSMRDALRSCTGRTPDEVTIQSIEGEAGGSVTIQQIGGEAGGGAPPDGPVHLLSANRAGLLPPDRDEFQRYCQNQAKPALQKFIDLTAANKPLTADAAHQKQMMQPLEGFSKQGSVTVKQGRKNLVFNLYVKDDENRLYALQRGPVYDYNRKLPYFDCGSLPNW